MFPPLVFSLSWGSCGLSEWRSPVSRSCPMQADGRGVAEPEFTRRIWATLWIHSWRDQHLERKGKAVENCPKSFRLKIVVIENAFFNRQQLSSVTVTKTEALSLDPGKEHTSTKVASFLKQIRLFRSLMWAIYVPRRPFAEYGSLYNWPWPVPAGQLISAV